MAYDIQLSLPSEWQKEIETYLDESGVEITHLEAHLYDNQAKRDIAIMDVYVGDMPQDTTAEDQAFSNYVDMVGFSEDDPDDYNPIFKIKFNGRNAYGFEAMCDNDSPMKFLTQEVRKGILSIICVVAIDEEGLNSALTLLERGLRIK